MKKKSVVALSLIVLIFVSTQDASCCSMFKLTMYGKTMVGNNEDYWNPNTRIWFERGTAKEHGAVYLGFDDFWPQGGMNDAGLVYDGFAMDYLAINDTLGKKSLGNSFLRDIMRSCTMVEEVKKYFSQYNLHGLETSMLLFVDKTGKYLVVEGDSLIIGNDQAYVLSNFYPSQVKSEKDIDIPFYHRGKKLLESRKDTSISFCASVMDSMHQERAWGGGTMYTSIYDLKEGLVYLYYFRDYTHVVKFNLIQELKKEDYSLIIPKLFLDNKKGQAFFNDYNAVNSALDLYKDSDVFSDSVRLNNVTNTLFKNNMKLISRFTSKITEIGNSWLEKGNYVAAISVFKINVRLMPESWLAYKMLADSYFKNNQSDSALVNYKKSIKFNQDNQEVKSRVEELIKQNSK